jgi:hypothetical protein
VPPKEDYYRDMRKQANEQRQLYGLRTSTIGRREFRRIYSENKIKIHLWPEPGLSGKKLKHLRGAYLNIDGDLHVMVDRTLPNDPYLFTLAHELKHHLCDSGIAKAFCHDENQSEIIELGAEIFGAEFLYPQSEFIADLARIGVIKGHCTQSDLVVLKHESGTSLSYTGIRKRAINFGYALPTLPNKGWEKIEYSIYGLPYHLR